MEQKQIERWINLLINKEEDERWRRLQVSTGPKDYYYNGWGNNHSVRCQNCLVSWDRGMSGDDATTVEDARVSAHANGWYVTGAAIICPPCRRKIADGMQEEDED